MAIDFRAIVSPPPAHPADRDNRTFAPDWNDQIVTLVAMALGLFILVAIAILMGTN